MENFVAFGPSDSYYFKYADPLKAASAGLPEGVRRLLEDPPRRISKLSCLALSPDGGYAMVYCISDKWFIGEHSLEFF
jgi:hypothetical protein